MKSGEFKCIYNGYKEYSWNGDMTMVYKAITDMLREDTDFQEKLKEAWKDNYEIKDAEDVIKLAHCFMNNINIEITRTDQEEYEIFKDFLCDMGSSIRIGKDKFSIRRLAKTVDGMYLRKRNIGQIDKYEYRLALEKRYFTDEIDAKVYVDFIDVIKADIFGKREKMIESICKNSQYSTKDYLDVEIVEKIIVEEKEANKNA